VREERRPVRVVGRPPDLDNVVIANGTRCSPGLYNVVKILAALPPLVAAAVAVVEPLTAAPEA
jgi:hypothetical protein